jgi:hypothetical protein
VSAGAAPDALDPLRAIGFLDLAHEARGDTRLPQCNTVLAQGRRLPAAVPRIGAMRRVAGATLYKPDHCHARPDA